MSDKKRTVLIAVYGSLLEGLSNHHIISNSKYIGEFSSKSKFTMIDLQAYPALIKNGNTSIRFQVYAVDDQTLERVNILEGFKEGSNSNFYEREILKTPFGDAFFYYQNRKVKENDYVVSSGDWYDHYSTKVKTY